MFINADSIIINGVSMGQYIVEAKYSYNKLWGEDSGRNLNGDMVASLIGNFVKIIVQFKPLNQSEMEIITPILDSARQTVTYYDPTKKTNVTMQTYTGDYEFINKHIINGMFKNEGFQVSFISTKKRVWLNENS